MNYFSGKDMDAEVKAREDVTTLFFGIAVPEQLKRELQQSIRGFDRYVDKNIPEETWHLTMLYWGEVENPSQYVKRLQKPLSQEFLPTVQLAYVGRGLKRSQLWAYGLTSPALLSLRESLIERLTGMRAPVDAKEKDGKAWQPHISLAYLYDVAAGMGIADQPITATFAVRELHLFESHSDNKERKYERLATIPLGE